LLLGLTLISHTSALSGLRHADDNEFILSTTSKVRK
jgi:hypothetical protein